LTINLRPTTAHSVDAPMRLGFILCIIGPACLSRPLGHLLSLSSQKEWQAGLHRGANEFARVDYERLGGWQLGRRQFREAR